MLKFSIESTEQKSTTVLNLKVTPLLSGRTYHKFAIKHSGNSLFLVLHLNETSKLLKESALYHSTILCLAIGRPHTMDSGSNRDQFVCDLLTFILHSETLVASLILYLWALLQTSKRPPAAFCRIKACVWEEAKKANSGLFTWLKVKQDFKMKT